MKNYMRITAAMLTLGFTIISASAEDTAPVKITEIFKREHPELADKEVLVKRIELQPGASAPPHVHPGMVTGYVESGVLEFQIKGDPLLTLKAGDTFFEPPGSHHMVARNPDPAAKTVVIVFVVNPKGAPLSTPIEDHGGNKK
jgi:quercetin dioxygenase-like cupin family protein